MSDNPRPFAAQAWALCTEDHEAPDAPWFCPMCQVLERRLEPISETLRAVVSDADLSLTFTWVDKIHDACGGVE